MKPLKLVPILFVAILTMPLTSFAHCKGKHSDYQPHCGGEDPPDESANPAFVVSGYGNSDDLVIIDINGNNVNKLVRRAGARPVTWLSDDSGILWVDGSNHSIRFVSADGNQVSTLFAATNDVDPYTSEWDSLATSTRCDSSSEFAYFIGRDLANDNEPDLYAINLDGSSQVVNLLDDSSLGHSGIAISSDGHLLATYTFPNAEDDGGLLNGRLELRDLCDPNLGVLFSWTKTDLGINRWIDTIDWSGDGQLAYSTVNEDVWVMDPFPLVGSAADTVKRLTGPGSPSKFGVDEIEQSVSWSPDGTQVAFVSSGSRRGVRQVYTVNVDTGVVTQVGGKWVYANAVDWRNSWEP